MKWTLGLRALVYLRRLVRACESLAKSHAELTRVMVAEYNAAHPPKRKVTTTFDTLDVAEVNRRWREERAANMIDEDEDAMNG